MYDSLVCWSHRHTQEQQLSRIRMSSSVTWSWMSLLFCPDADGKVGQLLRLLLHASFLLNNSYFKNARNSGNNQYLKEGKNTFFVNKQLMQHFIGRFGWNKLFSSIWFIWTHCSVMLFILKQNSGMIRIDENLANIIFHKLICCLKWDLWIFLLFWRKTRLQPTDETFASFVLLCSAWMGFRWRASTGLGHTCFGELSKKNGIFGEF